MSYLADLCWLQRNVHVLLSDNIMFSSIGSWFLTIAAVPSLCSSTPLHLAVYYEVRVCVPICTFQGSSEWVVRSQNTGRYTRGTPRCRGDIRKQVCPWNAVPGATNPTERNVSDPPNFFSGAVDSFFFSIGFPSICTVSPGSPQTFTHWTYWTHWTHCRSWGGPAVGPPIGRKSGFVRLFLARLRLGRFGRLETSDIWCDLDVFGGLSIVCLFVWICILPKGQLVRNWYSGACGKSPMLEAEYGRV